MHATQSLCNTVELAAESLCLRPWREADAPGLLSAVHESATAVGRWLPWCRADYTAEDAAAWIAHCQAGWRSGVLFAFAAVATDSGDVLGGAGLSQRSQLHRCANLGYWVRQSRQRQGIASTAARLVAHFGFERVGLIRIEILVLPDNTPSRATAASIGAQFESIARHRLWSREQARDAAVYSLLPRDLD